MQPPSQKRTIIALKLLAIAGAIFLSMYAYGQPNREYAITGTIKDGKNNLPLEYANIAIYSLPDSALVTGTITDQAGWFSLSVPKPGAYYAQADFLGYTGTSSGRFAVGDAHSSHSLATLFLLPADVALSEIAVVSDKPAVRYKMDKKIIDVSRNSAMQGGSAADALSGIPSISTDIEGEVTLRGSASFTVLVDGRLSPLNSSDALKQIPASAISSIEIITNPSVKYDPDGTAGIINIVTKKGKLKGHSVIANASAGTSPSYGGDVAYMFRAKRYMLSASAGYQDSQSAFTKKTRRTPDSTGVPSVTTAEDGQRRRTSGFVKIGTDYYATPNNTVTLATGANNFRYKRSYTSDIRQYDSLTEQSYSVTDQSFDVRPQSAEISVADKQIFNGNEKHYAYVSGQYQVKQKTNDEFVENTLVEALGMPMGDNAVLDQSSTDEDAYSLRIEAQYSHPLSETTVAEAGYALRNDAYTQHFSKTEQGTPYTDYATMDRTIHAGWVLVNSTIGSYSISAGLRTETTDRAIETLHDRYSYSYIGWYPSAGISKSMDKNQTLQLSYSKRINRPRDHHLNPFHRLSDGYTQFKPNPSLKPEQAQSFELNYQKSWGQNYIAAETFYRYTADEMERIETEVNDTLTRTIVNAGNESDAGLEINLNANVGKWWNINPIASTAYHTEKTDFVDTKETTASVWYEASVTNTWRYKNSLKLQLSGTYSGPRNIIGGTADAMYWVSVGLRYDFPNRQFSASLGVQDIFATRSRTNNTYSNRTHIYTYRQREGRTATVSLSYKLNASNNKRERKSRGQESLDSDY